MNLKHLKEGALSSYTYKTLYNAHAKSFDKASKTADQIKKEYHQKMMKVYQGKFKH